MVGIFAEGNAQEVATEVAHLTWVLYLQDKKTLITIFGDVVVASRFFVVYLDCVVCDLKRIAPIVFPVAEIGSFVDLGGGFMDLGGGFIDLCAGGARDDEEHDGEEPGANGKEPKHRTLNTERRTPNGARTRDTVRSER